ncbi:MAG: hypothetical protein EP338_00085 [Bacteroidetes bacterium]|nr:MAG: hypothetical protein EP338_00085 [Bacteroidota bacterium]
MDVHELLLELRQERNMPLQLERISKQPALIERLMQVVENGEAYPYSEYASWLLLTWSKKNKEQTQEFYERLVDVLFVSDNQSVLRNCASILTRLKHQPYREGELLDLLTGFLADLSHNVALHAMSLHLLVPFVRKYPELKGEIQEILKLHEHKKPALLSAIRNFEKKTPA